MDRMNPGTGPMLSQNLPAALPIDPVLLLLEPNPHPLPLATAAPQLISERELTEQLPESVSVEFVEDIGVTHFPSASDTLQSSSIATHSAKEAACEPRSALAPPNNISSLSSENSRPVQETASNVTLAPVPGRSARSTSSLPSSKSTHPTQAATRDRKGVAGSAPTPTPSTHSKSGTRPVGKTTRKRRPPPETVDTDTNNEGDDENIPSNISICGTSSSYEIEALIDHDFSNPVSVYL